MTVDHESAAVPGTGPEYQVWPPPEDVVVDPFGFFDTLRETHPVYRFPEPTKGRVTFLVTGIEAGTEVLRDGDRFLAPIVDEVDNPPLVPDEPSFYAHASIFETNGDDHRAKRRWAMRLVERERLESFRPLIQAEVDQLLDQFVDRGSCDFRAEFSDQMPLHVILQVLGISREHIPLVKRQSALIAAMEGNPNPSEEMLAALDQSMAELGRVVVATVRDRYAEPNGDYISTIIEMQVARDGALDVNAIGTQLLFTIFGGDHAVGGFMADLAAQLALHPEVQDELRADRSLVKRFALETLRVEPPVPWLNRHASQDTQLADVEIPAGAHIVVATSAANRDPSAFPRPSVFDLTRSNLERKMMTFGQGPHRCSGQAVALLEAEIAVNTMLDRMLDIRIDEEKSDLVTQLSFAFRVPRALHLTFTPA